MSPLSRRKPDRLCSDVSSIEGAGGGSPAKGGPLLYLLNTLLPLLEKHVPCTCTAEPPRHAERCHQGLIPTESYRRSTGGRLSLALRLGYLHVRCTCEQRHGHADGCDKLEVLKIMADAENLGVGMDDGTDGGRHSRAGLAETALRFLVPVLTLMTVASCAADAQQSADTVQISGIEVVVDSNYPTSIFVTGMPVGMRAAVGQVYTLISWPAEPGVDPETAPIPGTVVWSADDESVLFSRSETDTSVTYMVVTKPSARGVKLRAELKPKRVSTLITTNLRRGRP